MLKDAGKFGAYAPSPQYPAPPTDPKVLKNLGRWQSLKFGVLLDWQACTQWGVDSWQLCPERWDWNERKDYVHGTPEGAEQDNLKYKAAYEALARTFHPTRYDPEKWAELLENFRRQIRADHGKHTDGFCLWDTAQTDYKTTSPNCPFPPTARRGHGQGLERRVSQARHPCRRLFFGSRTGTRRFFWSPEFPMFPPDLPGTALGAMPITTRARIRNSGRSSRISPGIKSKN